MAEGDPDLDPDLVGPDGVDPEEWDDGWPDDEEYGYGARREGRTLLLWRLAGGVEVGTAAVAGPGGLLMRRVGTASALRFTVEEWRAFVAAVRAGEFDVVPVAVVPPVSGSGSCDG